jgi:hypothetical protein
VSLVFLASAEPFLIAVLLYCAWAAVVVNITINVRLQLLLPLTSALNVERKRAAFDPIEVFFILIVLFLTELGLCNWTTQKSSYN